MQERCSKEESAMAEQEVLKKQTRAPGERSRARVVEQAARLASIEGIEGISIGRLADATGIAKSSVYALFGSKEELQLATINAARDSFIAEVVAPAFNATEPGRQRLLTLCEGYLSYIERRVFPGGCFFVSASAEVGSRPGRVHDEVARIQQQWREVLGREASVAVDRGELPVDTDPLQLAFELGVILAGTNIVSVLHDDLTVIDRARTAVESRLSSVGMQR
jgi:AcrR family transcriptional regulator